MEQQEKSTGQKAARGAQIAGGIAKIAIGVASQNYAQAIIGAVEAFPWKKFFTVVGSILFILLIPIIIILSLPQILINWALSGFDDLISRNERGSEIVSGYYEVLDDNEFGVDPDINFLICLDAVRTNQQVESITDEDIKKTIESSYVKGPITGIIYNKSNEEIMDDYGFTEDQKNWTNLMYNTVIGQRLTSDESYIDSDRLESYEDVMLDGIVYYNQLDVRWANEKYGSATIGTAGCGPTALAMVVTALTGEETEPPEIAEWAEKHGHVCEGNGSYLSLIPEGAKKYDLTVERLGKSGSDELTEHLEDGKLIIAFMGKGKFTSTSHFIVLRGINDEGRVLVSDPLSYNRSVTLWDMSVILFEANEAGHGGPFWSFSYNSEE